MSGNLKKLKLILDNSSLPKNDQDGLLVLFARTPDRELEFGVKLFSEDIGWLKMINENYKAKQKAIAKKDPALWKKIIQEEQQELQALGE